MIEEDKLNALELFGENEYLHKEIERLKESEEYHRKGYAELYKRIDEAIEYLKRTDIDFYGNEWLVDALLNILQESDKE